MRKHTHVHTHTYPIVQIKTHPVQCNLFDRTLSMIPRLVSLMVLRFRGDNDPLSQVSTLFIYVSKERIATKPVTTRCIYCRQGI